ncbi:MAG: STAS domain-containing protein [Ideonella sp.]|nr:STAS domain-containing protein [Ideonella sp.]
MAEPKDNESFFRKVVKFVSNPSTEWSEIHSRHDELRDGDLEKSELKAMVERKRRNDFVRKREFDTLRRLRREGLSPEQLAALGGSSRIDDSEARMSETSIRQDTHVKAKIDEIEQQMVGEGFRNTSRRVTGSFNAPTEPLAFQPPHGTKPGAAGRQAAAAQAAKHQPDEERLPALPPLPAFDPPVSTAPAPVTMGVGMAPLIPPKAAPPTVSRREASMAKPEAPSAVEVSEVVHDPELDESVIAFANADFHHCESSLTLLVDEGGSRHQHSETWHVLFDLYRAIGQQAKFENRALDYANLFGSSAPQWFSLPQLVANAAAEEVPSAPRQVGEVGWACPPQLDVDAVARLRSTLLQLPLPWVLDWSALKAIDAEAASHLTALFRLWAPQRVEMRWLSGDQLLATLQEAAPTGSRDADPAYWMARLEALRLANRPDQFDEVAIDYCVTYEVSPPSWERAECVVRISGATLSTSTPPMSIISDVSTSFMDSNLVDDGQQAVQVASVELSGQLVGDIGATLSSLDQRLGAAPLITVSCARLIRVDFIAAGDLLNWVLSKRSQDRSVTFTESHRLIALFFGAMGINEHARVQVRRD